MARASSGAQQRQLTLTEELEKLEQSITLTLQEIDHNFSRAHRIVTSSILPIVEQYASHSKDVWEGSKFWKQFFESSANVSLSGYEDQSLQQDVTEENTTEDSHTTTQTTLETSQSYSTPSAQHISTDSIADLDISNMTLSPSKSSTPRPTRPPAPSETTATFADYPSPYEALRDEVTSTQSQPHAPSTPPQPNTHPTFHPSNIAMTPQSSPFLPPPPTSIPRPSTARKKTDPLLHRVLDRNYRIQATPLTSQRHKTNQQSAYRLPPQSTATPGTTRNHLLESTLSSSPSMPPPQLHEELFSPVRKPRTPGISVLTPAHHKHKPAYAQGAAKFTPDQPHAAADGIWDDSDDEDTALRFDASPPKTMQFHVPQSRLLKTPAKEASRRMVDAILTTAGVGRDDDEEEDELDADIDLDLDYDEQQYDGEDASPSMVRKAVGLEDETF